MCCELQNPLKKFSISCYMNKSKGIALCVVFGKKYLHQLHSRLLPSIYKQARDHNVEILLGTRKENLPDLKRICQGKRVRIWTFVFQKDLTEFENFSFATQVFLERLKKYQKPVLMLNADHCVNPGAVKYLIGISGTGKHVLTQSIRLLDHGREGSRQTPAIHPITQDLVYDPRWISNWPSSMIYTNRRQCLVLRGFHWHPILLWPHKLNIRKQMNSIDGDGIQQLKTKAIHYDSAFSNISLFEYSDPNKSMGGRSVRQGFPLPLAKLLRKNCVLNHVRSFYREFDLSNVRHLFPACPEVRGFDRLFLHPFFIEVSFWLSQISLSKLLAFFGKLQKPQSTPLLIPRQHRKYAEIKLY